LPPIGAFGGIEAGKVFVIRLTSCYDWILRGIERDAEAGGKVEGLRPKMSLA
jgi:hypothetical protein